MHGRQKKIDGIYLSHLENNCQYAQKHKIIEPSNYFQKLGNIFLVWVHNIKLTAKTFFGIIKFISKGINLFFFDDFLVYLQYLTILIQFKFIKKYFDLISFFLD